MINLMKALPTLTGSEVKAYVIIMNRTVGSGVKSKKITVDDFISDGGKTLANKPAVVNATNSLHDKGLIFKVLDRTDNLNFFCLNENYEGSTVL